LGNVDKDICWVVYGDDVLILIDGLLLLVVDVDVDVDVLLLIVVVDVDVFYILVFALFYKF
jgi:hypothetical protein